MEQTESIPEATCSTVNEPHTITMHTNQCCRMSDRSNASTSKMSSVTNVSGLQRRGFADVSNIRIPIVGYEVMEERARFTVSFSNKNNKLKTF